MEIQHHYSESGKGFPLILLHGNGEDHAVFAKQISSFAEHFHVYALDTRGHGKTPRGTAPFTISQFAEDLAGFMDAYGIDKAHILGFSDGGNIAAVFAIRYPQKVEKLILNGANLEPRGVKRRYQIPIELSYKFWSCFSKNHPKAKPKAEMLGLMVNDPFISIKELAKIRCETLVIAGTRDMIASSHTRLIAQHIPHARLTFIKGGHAVVRTNPLAFREEVLKFLAL
ncbi:MAG: alpha/beta hydrolase [Clostridia bacterium]|nr:alpha/beta hydrolase [Clostridia bacterium]